MSPNTDFWIIPPFQSVENKQIFVKEPIVIFSLIKNMTWCKNSIWQSIDALWKLHQRNCIFLSPWFYIPCKVFIKLYWVFLNNSSLNQLLNKTGFSFLIIDLGSENVIIVSSYKSSLKYSEVVSWCKPNRLFCTQSSF